MSKIRKNLVLKVFDGRLQADELTNSEQIQLLDQYNGLATMWVNSADPALRQMAREILLIVENSSQASESYGETIH